MSRPWESKLLILPKLVLLIIWTTLPWVIYVVSAIDSVFFKPVKGCVRAKAPGAGCAVFSRLQERKLSSLSRYMAFGAATFKDFMLTASTLFRLELTRVSDYFDKQRLTFADRQL
jgi:hypothetical protein